MNKERRQRGLFFMITLVGLGFIIFASCHSLEDLITDNANLIITDQDKAELIRLTLERALIAKEIPDYELIKDKANIVLSTENIDLNLVPKIPGVNLILLAPDQIQAKADQEGDFLYLRFGQMTIKESKVIVPLSNIWAVSKDSKIGYLSGGGFHIEYQKIDGKWVGKIGIIMTA